MQKENTGRSFLEEIDHRLPGARLKRCLFPIVLKNDAVDTGKSNSML
jgi:hypothetical protein